ncbi:hypothetical protein BDP27DRAFT_1535905 [Rhodocollybia butyracea]|uniref:Uncharacterized protein n=1 Tax=Rhodocollybia butyracea TaxID=206335 RepID=A0A9P5PKT0_9AGAR|nr:hypothetical protein BDP27DRAFT_1535905 [Rhodocollybia butyracea]
MAFDNTLGALLLGQTFAAILCGITFVQVIQFHKTSGKDSHDLKGNKRILDVIHQAFLLQGTYNLLVQNFGNFGALEHLVWGTEVYVQESVDFLYTIVWKSERRLIGPLIAIILLFAAVAFFTNFAYGIIGWRTPGHLVTGFNTRTMQILIYTTHTLEIIADVLITGSLVFYLQRGQTSFKPLDQIYYRNDYSLHHQFMPANKYCTNHGFGCLCCLAKHLHLLWDLYTTPKVNSRVSSARRFQDSTRDDIQLHSNSYTRDGGISQNRQKPAKIIIGIDHQVEARDERGNLKQLAAIDRDIESD